jgi:hypothetical protein
LHDKPVHPPLPSDIRNLSPSSTTTTPSTPPRASAVVQAKLLPLAAPLVQQDEITEIIDGWDDYDDALESENGDSNDEHVNIAVRSEMKPETSPNVRPEVPVAFAKTTHGHQHLVDSNRPVVDKYAHDPSHVVAPPPPPQSLPPIQPAVPSPAVIHDNSGIVQEVEEDSDWVYNTEDDCLPTRKRWRNPRPGPRQLVSFSANTSAS